MTAQAGNRQHDRNHRREDEHALVGAGRNDRLLEDELQEVGERLQHAPRPDHVRVRGATAPSPRSCVRYRSAPRSTGAGRRAATGFRARSRSERADVARVHPCAEPRKSAAADRGTTAAHDDTRDDAPARESRARARKLGGREWRCSSRRLFRRLRAGASARAEHSAMTREARAIGLVR